MMIGYRVQSKNEKDNDHASTVPGHDDRQAQPETGVCQNLGGYNVIWFPVQRSSSYYSAGATS